MAKQILIDYDEYLELVNRAEMTDKFRSSINVKQLQSPTSPIDLEVHVTIPQKIMLDLLQMPVLSFNRVNLLIRIDKEDNL